MKLHHDSEVVHHKWTTGHTPKHTHIYAEFLISYFFLILKENLENPDIW